MSDSSDIPGETPDDIPAGNGAEGGASSQMVADQPSDGQEEQVLWYRNPAVVVAGAVVLAVLLVIALLALRSGGDDASSGDAPAVASNPFDRALALHNAGELDQALALYEDILADNPDNEFVLYNIGQINHVRGNLGDAIGFYDRAVAINPEFKTAEYNRAIALRDLGRPDESIEAFETLLAQEEAGDGATAGVLFNLGNLLISQGDAERGTELVNRATQLDPRLRGD